MTATFALADQFAWVGNKNLYVAVNEFDDGYDVTPNGKTYELKPLAEID